MRVLDHADAEARRAAMLCECRMPRRCRRRRLPPPAAHSSSPLVALHGAGDSGESSATAGLTASGSHSMAHPHGIEPEVGVLGGGGDDTTRLRQRGLGALAAMPDEVLLSVLHELSPRDLARLATCSRVLWAFANHDELWKGFCLDVSAVVGREAPQEVLLHLCSCVCRLVTPPCLFTPHRFLPCRSWRGDGTSGARGKTHTWQALCPPTRRRPAGASCGAPAACSLTCCTHPGCELPLSWGRLRSYQWHCGSWWRLHTQPPPRPLATTPCSCATCALDPSWLEVENVDRRAGLTLAQFREQYETPNMPVILTDVVRRLLGPSRCTQRQGATSSACPAGSSLPRPDLRCLRPACPQVTQWPAMQLWSREYLKKAFKDGMVR